MDIKGVFSNVGTRRRKVDYFKRLSIGGDHVVSFN